MPSQKPRPVQKSAPGLQGMEQRDTFVYILMSILSFAVFIKIKSQNITTTPFLYLTFIIRKVSL